MILESRQSRINVSEVRTKPTIKFCQYFVRLFFHVIDAIPTECTKERLENVIATYAYVNVNEVFVVINIFRFSFCIIALYSLLNGSGFFIAQKSSFTFGVVFSKHFSDQKKIFFQCSQAIKKFFSSPHPNKLTNTKSFHRKKK